MTTREALCAVLVAILLVTAGFTWLFGPYGLMGGGLAVFLLTVFADAEEVEDDDG